MNKKELAHVRKQFKKDRSTIKVNTLMSVYINGDSKKVLKEHGEHFEYLEDDIKDLFFKNFKKALSGNFDVKLFEREYEVTPKHIKELTSDSGTFSDNINLFVEKFLENYPYDRNVVLHLAQFTLYRGDKTHEMVVGTVNKTDFGKPKYIYSHENESFEMTVSMEPEINLSAPMDGFLYPVWEDDGVSANKILYYSSKANKMNPIFMQNVLGSELKLSAKQEKDYFHLITKLVFDGRISSKTLSMIYEEIESMIIEKGDDKTVYINKEDMLKILEDTGETIVGNIDEIFKECLGSADYEFKGENIIPNFSKKSILLSNAEMDMKINPNNLNDIKKTIDKNGQTVLVVKLYSDIETDGFDIEMEK